MSDEVYVKTTHELRIPGGYDWPDFIARTWMINEVVVGVEAFEVIGTEGDDPIPIMLKRDGTSSSDVTTNPDEAEYFVEGSIKWDGCSNLTLGRGGYFHFCDRADGEQLGNLLTKLYDLAKEAMGNRAIW